MLRLWQSVAVITRINLARDADLLEVAQAMGCFRPGLGAGQRRQEHRRQNGNDGNHHQQFDQSKSALPTHVLATSRLKTSALGTSRDWINTYRFKPACDEAIKKTQTSERGGGTGRAGE